MINVCRAAFYDKNVTPYKVKQQASEQIDGFLSLNEFNIVFERFGTHKSVMARRINKYMQNKYVPIAQNKNIQVYQNKQDTALLSY